MSEPNEPNLERLSDHFQPAVLFEAFNRHGVNYVVVGGIAAVIHGAEVSTVDLDMVVEQSKENLDRVTDALFELGALRVTYTDSGMPVPESGYELTETVESFVTHQGHIDILRQGRVVGGYNEIGQHAQAVIVRGQTVYVADLDTVIAEAEAANRPKDRDHLASLYDLRDTLKAAERGEPLTEPAHGQHHNPADRLANIHKQLQRTEEILAQLQAEREEAERQYEQQQPPEPLPEHNHGYDH